MPEPTNAQLDQIEARLADTRPLPPGSHVQRDPWHTASAIEEILDVHTPALIAEVRQLRAAIATVDAIERCPYNPGTMQGFELDQAQGYNDALTEVHRALHPEADQ